MSLPWKSELLIRLGRTSSAVQVLAPWSRRVLAQGEGAGTAAVALPAALQALRDAGHDALPRRARLLVPDECAYLKLHTSHAAWPRARQEAVDHFVRTLGRQDLIVQIAAMPGDRAWMAAAIEPQDLAVWRQALADAGIRLTSVQLALIEDVNAVAPRLRSQAIVALMREEGLTVLRIAGGAPVDLSWERCDPHSARCIEQRLMASQLTGNGDRAAPLLMLCRDEAQRAEWESRARGHQWKLLLAGARSVASPVRSTA